MDRVNFNLYVEVEEKSKNILGENEEQRFVEVLGLSSKTTIKELFEKLKEGIKRTYQKEYTGLL